MAEVDERELQLIEYDDQDQPADHIDCNDNHNSEKRNRCISADVDSMDHINGEMDSKVLLHLNPMGTVAERAMQNRMQVLLP